MQLHETSHRPLSRSNSGARSRALRRSVAAATNPANGQLSAARPALSDQPPANKSATRPAHERHVQLARLLGLSCGVDFFQSAMTAKQVAVLCASSNFKIVAWQLRAATRCALPSGCLHVMLSALRSRCRTSVAISAQAISSSRIALRRGSAAASLTPASNRPAASSRRASPPSSGAERAGLSGCPARNCDPPAPGPARP